MLRDFGGLKLPMRTSFAESAPIKSSVQKAVLVARLVQGMHVSQALLQLKFCKRKVAKDILGVLQSAVANAENNFGYDIDKLHVSRIWTNKAFNLRRMRLCARGRGRSVKKYYTTVTVFVSEM